MKFFGIFLISAISTMKVFALNAPGWPGMTPTWSSAKKIQTGTSYSKNQLDTQSLVWFSLAKGVLTETYFPTIDEAQIKDAQILVSDGESFLIDEKKEMEHEVEVLHPSLVKMVNKDKLGRFKVEHTFFTVNSESILVDEVKVFAYRDGLSFYHLVNSALKGTGYSDSVMISNDEVIFYEKDTNLSVSSSVGYKKLSTGFVGHSDGYQDLKDDFKMDWSYNRAISGNVASTGEINIPRKKGIYTFYLVYKFSNKKFSKANLKVDYAKEKEKYILAWDSYLRGLKIPKKRSNHSLYYRSMFTLRVHEDKINPGAMIASLSNPWGEEVQHSPSSKHGGYHLVWPRDLFHVSIAMLYAGDRQAPLRALGYLKEIQYQEEDGKWFYGERIIPKKGAFPQNVWTTGVPYWSGLQIDQVAYPIQLFYHLWAQSNKEEKQKLIQEFGVMISDALQFIVNYGPWSAQERWEENFGISPSSFAAAATALKMGSEIFKKPSLDALANTWISKPGDNIHTWTFTQSGVYGDGQYYLRVAGCDSYIGTWDPNRNVDCYIANSGEKKSQKEILDQGFLKLSLFGLVSPNDWRIKKSLELIDQKLSVKTPKGVGYYRYSFDAYGESKRGRLWPILLSEHARYYIELHRKGFIDQELMDKKVQNIYSSYFGAENAGGLLPEQIFEATGEGTGAATPLAWSHAEFIKLIWSEEYKKNVTNLLD